MRFCHTEVRLRDGVLQVAAGLAGDFNADGSVDAADYVVWRKTGGAQIAYDTWRANFGATANMGLGASGSSVQLPAPATLVTLLVAMASIIAGRFAIAS